MVSVTIMLIVLAALIALFLNVNNTQREMVKVNRQIEGGRLSVFVLENEITHAGFWENYMPEFDDLTVSGVPAKVPTGNAPDPCLPYSAVNWTEDYKRSLLDMPVQAYDAVPASCAGLLTNKKADTDVLVVRHAETCVAGMPNCEADTLGQAVLPVVFLRHAEAVGFRPHHGGLRHHDEQELHDPVAQAQVHFRHLLRARLRRNGRRRHSDPGAFALRSLGDGAGAAAARAAHRGRRGLSRGTGPGHAEQDRRGA